MDIYISYTLTQYKQYAAHKNKKKFRIIKKLLIIFTGADNSPRNSPFNVKGNMRNWKAKQANTLAKLQYLITIKSKYPWPILLIIKNTIKYLNDLPLKVSMASSVAARVLKVTNA